MLPRVIKQADIDKIIGETGCIYFDSCGSLPITRIEVKSQRYAGQTRAQKRHGYITSGKMFYAALFTDEEWSYDIECGLGRKGEQLAKKLVAALR